MIGKWIDNIKNKFNRNNADQSEIDSSVTYWDTDMDVSDPGVKYDSWDDFEKGKVSDTDKGSSTTSRQTTSTYRKSRPKRELRKIHGGRVLQYPIDIDINLQDYFEIQVFKYRAAGR